MSAVEETELKAGHAPAVKAGGMRVVTRPRHSSTGEGKPEVQKEEEEEEFPAAPKPEKHNLKVNLSGAIGKGDQDFTPEAIKQYHEKPTPTKDSRNTSRPAHNIKQPK